MWENTKKFVAEQKDYIIMSLMLIYSILIIITMVLPMIATYEIESDCKKAGITNVGDYVLVCHHVDEWNVNIDGE